MKGLPAPREEIRPDSDWPDAGLGRDCYILKGVTIGEGAIVGAASVVLSDVPQFCVAIGNPARVVRKGYNSPHEPVPCCSSISFARTRGQWISSRTWLPTGLCSGWVRSAGRSGLRGFLREQRPSLRTPQIFLMVALLFAVVLSRIAQGWLGGGLIALTDFGTTAAVFFLIVLVVNSIQKLAAVALAMVLCSLFLAGQAIAAYHFGYDAKRFVIGQSTTDGDEYSRRRRRFG